MKILSKRHPSRPVEVDPWVVVCDQREMTVERMDSIFASLPMMPASELFGTEEEIHRKLKAVGINPAFVAGEVKDIDPDAVMREIEELVEDYEAMHPETTDENTRGVVHEVKLESDPVPGSLRANPTNDTLEVYLGNMWMTVSAPSKCYEAQPKICYNYYTADELKGPE